MFWAGRHPKEHYVPIPLTWGGTPSTWPGYQSPIQPNLEHFQAWVRFHKFFNESKKSFSSRCKPGGKREMMGQKGRGKRREYFEVLYSAHAGDTFKLVEI